MSFTAVHIPDFPVAAWLSNAPQLRDRPLVVLKGMPPQELVASVNLVAVESDISHGMSKVQAETAWDQENSVAVLRCLLVTPPGRGRDSLGLSAWNGRYVQNNHPKATGLKNLIGRPQCAVKQRCRRGSRSSTFRELNCSHST